MTNTDQIWQRLDRMLELYRLYQEIELIGLAEATIELNSRWISYGEHKAGLDVKPKPRDRSYLKVVD